MVSVDWRLWQMQSTVPGAGTRSPVLKRVPKQEKNVTLLNIGRNFFFFFLISGLSVENE